MGNAGVRREPAHRCAVPAARPLLTRPDPGCSRQAGAKRILLFLMASSSTVLSTAQDEPRKDSTGVLSHEDVPKARSSALAVPGKPAQVDEWAGEWGDDDDWEASMREIDSQIEQEFKSMRLKVQKDSVGVATAEEAAPSA